MKLNWGTAIVITMICFMAFIATLTTKMMMKSTDLESEDYYQREVDYEQEIQAQLNANSTDVVSFTEQEDHYIINVAPNTEIEPILVELRRPNDANEDRAFEFSGNSLYLIPKSALKKGKYSVQISYELNSKTCLIKDEIIVD